MEHILQTVKYFNKIEKIERNFLFDFTNLNWKSREKVTQFMTN
jgi:hypothetical protein